jgi:hypothetical protein
MNKYPKEFTKVADICVPDKLFEVIKTGVPELDKSFSEIGGLVPSQVIMVTGNPGSGKTTLCAVVGSKVSKNDPRPAVFLSYEMSDFQLKLQASKIPGFSDLLISTHEFYQDSDGLDSLFAALDMIQPSVVIADSLQKMASKMPHGPKRGQIVLVERFTKWAKESFVPVLLIGHNDKGGNYAGPSFLKHEVDSHLVVTQDRETRERFFSMTKNRFGGNVEEYFFRISSDGVYIGEEWFDFNQEKEEDLVDVVKRFKENGAGRFKSDEFRKVAEGLVNYLNHKYQEELQENSRDASKIKVEWHDSYSYCNINSGKLILTTSIFEDWERVPYQREKPFADKYAKTREEMAIWKVIHEWSHLFQGCHKHASPLWSRIDSVAAQEPWLWS